MCSRHIWEKISKKKLDRYFEKIFEFLIIIDSL